MVELMGWLACVCVTETGTKPAHSEPYCNSCIK